MRRRAPLFVALALCFAGAVYADGVDLPAEINVVEQVKVCSPVAPGEEVAAEWASEFVPGKIVEAGPVPIIGPCPVERDCTGGANTCSTNPANCEIGRNGTRTDTGRTACLLSGGGTFYCPSGKTIHVKKADCVQCPCCTTGPIFCACLNECGEVQRWGCA